MHLLPGFPHALQRARRIFCRRGRHRVFVTFHADDIRHQHGVMRSHRTTRFGDYRRMRQTVFFTRITNRPDDVVGIFIEAVVYGAVRLRTGAFIVHAQTAADVEALNIDAQLVQLNIETRGFTNARGDIANIRHLRTKVEVQQLQAVETPGFTQGFNQLQYLSRRQAELRFFPAGGLPFTRALRSQTCTHAQTRNDIQTFCFIQHNGNF